jgi:hypothetical protein
MEREAEAPDLQYSDAARYVEQNYYELWNSYDLERLERLAEQVCPELQSPQREATRRQMALMVPLVFEAIDRIDDPEYGNKRDVIYKSFRLAAAPVSARVGSSTVLRNLRGLYEGGADDARDHLFADMERIYQAYRRR